MTRLVHVFVALLSTSLVSCVSQIEYMAKGGERGDRYLYAYHQLAGQGTGQSSMGTAVAFDGQKSFADFLQFATAYATLDFATKQALYKEVTRRYELGQITQQQKIAADLAIGQSSTAAELQIALAKIAAG